MFTCTCRIGMCANVCTCPSLSLTRHSLYACTYRSLRISCVCCARAHIPSFTHTVHAVHVHTHTHTHSHSLSVYAVHVHRHTHTHTHTHTHIHKTYTYTYTQQDSVGIFFHNVLIENAELEAAQPMSPQVSPILHKTPKKKNI